MNNSRSIIGYDADLIWREAFRVRGYTIVSPPGKRGEAQVPEFWKKVIADGRLAKLKAASSVQAPVLGLGSWDPECPKGGARYTICIAETAQTTFTALRATDDLFSKDIGASHWLCFHTTLGDEYPGRFWKDNPYKMMGQLGYSFHGAPGDYSIGLHFEVYPPDFSFGTGTNKKMEFWITVTSSTAEGTPTLGG